MVSAGQGVPEYGLQDLQVYLSGLLQVPGDGLHSKTTLLARAVLTSSTTPRALAQECTWGNWGSPNTRPAWGKWHEIDFNHSAHESGATGASGRYQWSCARYQNMALRNHRYVGHSDLGPQPVMVNGRLRRPPKGPQLSLQRNPSSTAGTVQVLYDAV